MNDRRKLILIGLAVLTLVFVSAAAYAILEGGLVNRGDHTIDPLPLGEVPEALRITVTEPGFVAIDAKQLDEIFLPIESISADTLSLTSDGEPVPFYVDGQGADAALYFFAQTVTNTLEAPAVYWLEPGRGLEMKERNAVPSGPYSETGILTERWEDNAVFLAQAAGEDVWLGELIFAPSSIDIDLDAVRSDGGPGELTIRIWSNNQAVDNPDHHVVLSLNGTQLMEHYWDGIKQETITVSLPAGLLREEDNVLTIAAPGDTGAAGEALYIDWIELKYEEDLRVENGSLAFESDDRNLKVRGVNNRSLLFDITDEDRPVALVNGEISGNEISFASPGENSTYFVLNPDGLVEPQIDVVPKRLSLKEPGRGADALIIRPCECEPRLAHSVTDVVRVLREVAGDHGDLELPQDRLLRLTFQQEPEGLLQ